MRYTFNLDALARDLAEARLSRSTKTYRLGRGSVKLPMSMRDAAAQMGISAPTISRTERGIAPPDTDTFLAMCDWLGKQPGNYFEKPKKTLKSKGKP